MVAVDDLQIIAKWMGYYAIGLTAIGVFIGMVLFRAACKVRTFLYASPALAAWRELRYQRFAARFEARVNAAREREEARLAKRNKVL